MWVTLPGKSSTPRDGEVWIKDNGPGMTLGVLNNALRAGWTSNDRYGQLGLFGVGFNIATARLGHLAMVRTARRDDSMWTVVMGVIGNAVAVNVAATLGRALREHCRL